MFRIKLLFRKLTTIIIKIIIIRFRFMFNFILLWNCCHVLAEVWFDTCGSVTGGVFVKIVFIYFVMSFSYYLVSHSNIDTKRPRRRRCYVRGVSSLIGEMIEGDINLQRHPLINNTRNRVNSSVTTYLF